MTSVDALPDDAESLKQLLLAREEQLAAVAAEAATLRAKAADDPATLSRFRQTMRGWLAWSRQNPRESDHFFDDDRAPWQERGR